MTWLHTLYCSSTNYTRIHSCLHGSSPLIHGKVALKSGPLNVPFKYKFGFISSIIQKAFIKCWQAMVWWIQLVNMKRCHVLPYDWRGLWCFYVFLVVVELYFSFQGSTNRYVCWNWTFEGSSCNVTEIPIFFFFLKRMKQSLKMKVDVDRLQSPLTALPFGNLQEKCWEI